MRIIFLVLFPMLALAQTTVRIEGSVGDLNIEGWDQPTVQVDVSGNVQVTKTTSGDELTIATAHKRFSGLDAEYRIRVPRNANLVIHHTTGAVTVYDVAGNIDAHVSQGDIVVQLPAAGKYEIDAHAKFGTVYSDYGHPHHPHLKIGETLKAPPEGAGTPHRIVLRVGAGGIAIQKAPALLSLN